MSWIGWHDTFHIFWKMFKISHYCFINLSKNINEFVYLSSEIIKLTAIIFFFKKKVSTWYSYVVNWMTRHFSFFTFLPKKLLKNYLSYLFQFVHGEGEGEGQGNGGRVRKWMERFHFDFDFDFDWWLTKEWKILQKWKFVLKLAQVEAGAWTINLISTVMNEK